MYNAGASMGSARSAMGPTWDCSCILGALLQLTPAAEWPAAGGQGSSSQAPASANTHWNCDFEKPNAKSARQTFPSRYARGYQVIDEGKTAWVSTCDRTQYSPAPANTPLLRSRSVNFSTASVCGLSGVRRDAAIRPHSEDDRAYRAHRENGVNDLNGHPGRSGKTSVLALRLVTTASSL
jgi:hypothetical protein